MRRAQHGRQPAAEALRRSIETAVREHYPRGIAPSSVGQGVSTIRVEMPYGTFTYRVTGNRSLIAQTMSSAVPVATIRGIGRVGDAKCLQA